MDKFYYEWRGEKFPAREIELPKELGGFTTYVADYELWNAIEEDYENGDRKARNIDNEIFFYCDSGFIEGDPTDGEIIEYLNGHVG